VFFQRSDVAADNNACERALRPSVIHRKIMGSFRCLIDTAATSAEAAMAVMIKALRELNIYLPAITTVAGNLLLQQGEPEAAAFTQFAIDADLPPHRLDKRLRNRQAQTGAATEPRLKT
jgi:hypothetical protein